MGGQVIIYNILAVVNDNEFWLSINVLNSYCSAYI